MSEYLIRQINQLRFSISDFHNGKLDFNSFIRRMEMIGTVIGGGFWEDCLFPLILDLEIINSELIDKSRNIDSEENKQINSILDKLEEVLIHEEDSLLCKDRRSD
ncbi:hypothetical protein [Methylomonas sp. CM2]|uniref:hypothetical protein n=1 Tax=Methylomonas sp. CM2 TaxID=3417647 RepID=UPI003CE6892E